MSTYKLTYHQYKLSFFSNEDCYVRSIPVIHPTLFDTIEEAFIMATQLREEGLQLRIKQKDWVVPHFDNLDYQVLRQTSSLKNALIKFEDIHPEMFMFNFRYWLA